MVLHHQTRLDWSFGHDSVLLTEAFGMLLDAPSLYFHFTAYMLMTCTGTYLAQCMYVRKHDREQTRFCSRTRQTFWSGLRGQTNFFKWCAVIIHKIVHDFWRNKAIFTVTFRRKQSVNYEPLWCQRRGREFTWLTPEYSDGRTSLLKVMDDKGVQSS